MKKKRKSPAKSLSHWWGRLWRAYVLLPQRQTGGRKGQRHRGKEKPRQEVIELRLSGYGSNYTFAFVKYTIPQQKSHSTKLSRG